jgi:hypothetical protein
MQAKRLMNGFEVIYRYFGLRNKQLQAEMIAGKPKLIGARQVLIHCAKLSAASLSNYLRDGAHLNDTDQN